MNHSSQNYFQSNYSAPYQQFGQDYYRPPSSNQQRMPMPNSRMGPGNHMNMNKLPYQVRENLYGQMELAQQYQPQPKQNYDEIRTRSRMAMEAEQKPSHQTFQQQAQLRTYQPPSKKLTSSRYSQLDLTLARRDLRLLKSKLGSRQGLREQQSVPNFDIDQIQKAHKTQTNYARVKSRQVEIEDEEELIPKRRVVQEQHQSKHIEPSKNQQYRKAFKPEQQTIDNGRNKKIEVENDHDREIPSAVAQRNNFKGHSNTSKQESIPQVPVNQTLEECPTCGRSFNLKALEKHLLVCEKVFVKKRKAFNTAEHRMDKEQKELMQKEDKKSKKSTQGKKNQDKPVNGMLSNLPKWKIQSMQFRNAIATSKDGVAPSNSDFYANAGGAMSFQDPSYQKCPHCSRTFNEDAAERHIAFCAKKAKENALKGNNNKKGVGAKMAETMGKGGASKVPLSQRSLRK